MTAQMVAADDRPRVEIVTRDLRRSPAGTVKWLLRDRATGDHYVASGVDVPLSGWEVLIFPADQRGTITDWYQVAGGKGVSHEQAVADLEATLVQLDQAQAEVPPEATTTVTRREPAQITGRAEPEVVDAELIHDEGEVDR